MPQNRDRYLSQLPHRKAVRLHRAQNFIWVWLGLAATLSAVQYFLQTDTANSAIYSTMPSVFLIVWHVLFALGGLLIAYGVWTYHPLAEVIGHIFFCAGCLVNCVALLTVIGGGPNFFIVGAAGAASIARAYFIVKTTPPSEK